MENKCYAGTKETDIDKIVGSWLIHCKYKIGGIKLENKRGAEDDCNDKELNKEKVVEEEIDVSMVGETNDEKQ